MNITDLIRALRAMIIMLVLAAPLSQANAQGDPPGRVARLNYFNGEVTFAPAGSEEWAFMQLNRPLTTGDRIWVDRGARSELHIGSTVLRLGSQTSLDFLNLDDNVAHMKVTQGTLNLRLRALPPGESFEIDTPNLAFSIQSAGEYRLNIAADGGTTTVTVRNGRGTAYGDSGALAMRGGQQVSFSGTDLMQVAASDAPPYDSFDNWTRSRDRAEDTAASARYVSREVIGYEQLDDYGTWRETVQYGAVWVPRVTAAGWSPYHSGHWAWVAPWGWTWIDDAPWGFAPYHYGRWTYFDRAWCWVPGPVVRSRPVYAPALVAFVGGRRANVNAGVAWFPLGPGEIYRPAYVASPAYIRNLNKAVGIHNATVHNTTVNRNDINKTVYVNRGAPNAITAVSATAFVNGLAVAPVARALKPQQVAQARITNDPAIMPVKQSVLGAARPAAIPHAATAMQRPVVAPIAPTMRARPHDPSTQPGNAMPASGAAPGRQTSNLRGSLPKNEHLQRRPAPMARFPAGAPPAQLEAAVSTPAPPATMKNGVPRLPFANATSLHRAEHDGAAGPNSVKTDGTHAPASAHPTRDATDQQRNNVVHLPVVNRNAPAAPHDAEVRRGQDVDPHRTAHPAALPTQPASSAKPSESPHDVSIRNEGKRPVPQALHEHQEGRNRKEGEAK